MKRKRIPEELYRQVEPELLAGETLLWAGKPKSKLAAIDNRVALSIVAVVLGILMAVGIGLFGFFSVRTGSGAPNVAVFAPFLGIIVLMMVMLGARFASFTQSMGSTYAITDRRALILSKKSVQSYGPDDIRFIERKMRGENIGDIIFDQQSTYGGSGMYGGQSSQVDIGFKGIEYVREVEALMLETFRPDEDDAFYSKSRRADRLEDYTDDADQAVMRG